MPGMPDVPSALADVGKYSHTILRAIYIAVLIISGSILYDRASGIGRNERFTFSCRGAAKFFETSCLTKYNSGPNFLQSWLYDISFWIPLGIIVPGIILLPIKLVRYKKDKHCTVHIHQLYFVTLALQIVPHCVVFGLLLANLDDMNMTENYDCVIGNVTFTCIDEKAKQKSDMNMVCFVFTIFFIVFILFELCYYLSKWIINKKEREGQVVKKGICKECHFFVQRFSPFPDEPHSSTSENQVLNSGSRGGYNTIQNEPEEGSAASTDGGPGSSVYYAVPIEPQVASDKRDSIVKKTRDEESSATSSEAWKDKLVKDLGVNNRERLSTLLDRDSGFQDNWYYLARHLGFSENEAKAMDRDGIGGGHPAKDFLMNLQMKYPSKTVADIIDKCEEMGRNDIRLFFTVQNVLSNTALHNLSPETVEKLAEELSSKGGVGKDWKALAGRFDYSPEEIEQFGARKGTFAYYSPTEALLSKLRTSRPNMTFGELAKALRDIKREDVIEELKSFP